MSWLSKFLGTGKQTTTTTQALDPGSQRYVDQMRQMSQGGANLALAGPGGVPNGPGGTNFGMGQQPPGPGGPPTTGTPGSYAPGLNGGGGPAGNSWFTGPQTQSIADQVSPFMNPYMSNVIGGVRGEFDQLRGQASMGANQQATQAGAFGGSRHGVMEGARLGELDRAQTSQIGGLLAGGYQQALGQGLGYAEQQRQLQQQQQMEPLWRQQQAQGMMNFGMGPTGGTTTQTMPGASPFGMLVGAAATGYGAYKGAQQGGGGLQVGGQVPQGYQSAPNFGMPQPWQQPQWNPQYQGTWG